MVEVAERRGWEFQRRRGSHIVYHEGSPGARFGGGESEFRYETGEDQAPGHALD